MDEFRIPKMRPEPMALQKAGDCRDFATWRREEMSNKKKSEKQWKRLTKSAQRADEAWCEKPPRSWTPAPKRFTNPNGVTLDVIVGRDGGGTPSRSEQSETVAGEQALKSVKVTSQMSRMLSDQRFMEDREFQKQQEERKKSQQKKVNRHETYLGEKNKSPIRKRRRERDQAKNTHEDRSDQEKKRKTTNAATKRLILNSIPGPRTRMSDTSTTTKSINTSWMSDEVNEKPLRRSKINRWREDKSDDTEERQAEQVLFGAETPLPTVEAWGDEDPEIIRSSPDARHGWRWQIIPLELKDSTRERNEYRMKRILSIVSSTQEKMSEASEKVIASTEIVQHIQPYQPCRQPLLESNDIEIKTKFYSPEGWSLELGCNSSDTYHESCSNLTLLDVFRAARDEEEISWPWTPPTIQISSLFQLLILFSEFRKERYFAKLQTICRIPRMTVEELIQHPPTSLNKIHFTKKEWSIIIELWRNKCVLGSMALERSKNTPVKIDGYNKTQNELAAKLSIALTEWRCGLEAIRCRYLVIGGSEAETFCKKIKRAYFFQLTAECPLFKKFTLSSSVECIIIWPSTEREIETIEWLTDCEWGETMKKVAVPCYIISEENMGIGWGETVVAKSPTEVENEMSKRGIEFDWKQAKSPQESDMDKIRAIPVHIRREFASTLQNLRFQ